MELITKCITFPLLLAALSFVLGCTKESVEKTVTVTGTPAWVFNGIPKIDAKNENGGWGDPLVYALNKESADTRMMSTSGGIPVVCVYTPQGGVAIYNAKEYFEPFTVAISIEGEKVFLKGTGGSDIGVITLASGEDYYDALRKFALIMKKKGIASQKSPEWGFDPIWETYGFVEDWNRDKIRALLPVIKKLGIKTITLDSGWFGKGAEEWDAMSGDYPINDQAGGSEESLKAFIDELHLQGFKVRGWWSPLTVDKGTKTDKKHRDWFYAEEIPSWSVKEEGDRLLNPANSEVQEWNRSIVKRFVGYGFDGFKQDDIYQIPTDDVKVRKAYASVVCENLKIAQEIKRDFTINTCNCGVAQNFYQFPGENQLITSDPTTYQSIRQRGKILHALNVSGSAILGDHVELGLLTDVEDEEAKQLLGQAAWYNDADLASQVALGMVLETKFTRDPGKNYERWFKIFHEKKFVSMEWINVPFFGEYPERYIMKSNDAQYHSFFTENYNDSYKGSIVIDHIEKGSKYSVTNIETNKTVAVFTADSTSHAINTAFKGHLVLEVKKTD